MDAHLAFHFAKNRRLHLAVCGSVAAYRSPDLVRMWSDAGIHVSATLSPAAMHFITPLTFEALGASPVYGDMFGGSEVGGSGPFDHLEPGQSAQAMVIAPASADTIARLACGMADTMVACQALAFRGPLIIAPAMNPAMWSNPATKANIATLRARGHVVVEPACGRTACLEEGQGRLADLRLIYAHGLRALALHDSMLGGEPSFIGKNVMVTLGPTQERWDGVRHWTNPSTGIMGASLAMAAWLRGAEVHAICGPNIKATTWLPEGYGVSRYDVGSARDMFEVAESVWENMDYGIFTAAVADFSPVPYGAEKFKKASHGDGFDIRFTPNPDILATLGNAKKPHQKVMGFAAETDNLLESMRSKLARKNADMIVGNYIGGVKGSSCAGFGSATNAVHILDIRGQMVELAQQSKPDIAWSALSWLQDL